MQVRSRRSQSRHEVPLISEKLAILVAVGTLQPIAPADILGTLEADFSASNLKSALKELKKDKLLASLPDSRIYLTELGRSGLGAGPLGLLRDRSRMLYIISKNKEGSHKA